MTLYNIYCDESCHLEHDRSHVMVLGAIVCPQHRAQESASRIREIKRKHRLPPDFDVKWTKVSLSKVEFYTDLLDYFFDDDDLTFRAIVVPDKSKLDHAHFAQSHDDFYYKMYFQMLKVLLDPEQTYRIYLDIKDTRSARKTKKLHEVLGNSLYDYNLRIVQGIDLVRSEHVQQVQLADLLIGAIGYANRGLSTNEGKNRLVARIRARSRYSLTKSTLVKSRKVNLLLWQPQDFDRA